MVMITPEQATSVIAAGEYIHTFRSGRVTLFGADWDRADILEAIDAHPAELAGVTATSMGHGIVINDGTFLFVETDKDRLSQLMFAIADAARATAYSGAIGKANSDSLFDAADAAFDAAYAEIFNLTPKEN